MHGTNFLYLASIVVVAGGALWLELWRAGKRWRRYRRAFLWIFIIALVGTLAEAVSLKWGGWEYGKAYTFHQTFLGAEVETYLFSVATAIAIAFPAFLLAEREDRHESVLRFWQYGFRAPKRTRKKR